MAVYMIGYDLHNDHDYKQLTDEIKKLGVHWHGLDSTCMVVSDKKPKEIRELLKPHLHAQGKLMVVKIAKGSYAVTGFSTSKTDWIKNHLSAASPTKS